MKKLTIVQMNDSHAYFEPHPEIFWERGKAVYRQAGGYARIASLIKQIREETSGEVLLLDGGDTFHGTYPALQTKGENIVPIMNLLAPAAMTAHWEFAYTPQGFKALTAQLTYPMLAINVYEKESGNLFFRPYEITDVAGLRVGIVGIASNIVGKMMPPHFSEGVTFTDGVKELPGVIDTLRGEEKVDLVILLSHLGFPQDMALLKQVPGVDIALSAHTHHRLEQAIRQGDTLVVQSGSQGSFITRLDLTLNEGRITDFSHRLIEVSQDIASDPEMEHLVQKALRPYQEELSQVVGHTRGPLDRALNLEATMDNLLLSALLDHTGAQLAFSNGWRYGAPILPGAITLNDLYNMTPMNPPVSTVELSGEELITMLENNLEHTFSRDPFNQMGGYVKRSLGMRAFIKVENPEQTRIHKLFIGDAEVRRERRYQAVFITEQGVPPHLGENKQQHPAKMVEVMRAYLRKNDPVTIDLKGTYTLI